MASSSTVTNTAINDNRGVADANAQTATNGGSTAKDNGIVNRPSIYVGTNSTGTSATANINLNTTLTDYGSIEKAIKFAETNNAGANATIKSVLGVAEGNFDKTTKALTEAYKDAKGGALVLQNVTVGMMVTIAAIAYFWLGRKKT